MPRWTIRGVTPEAIRAVQQVQAEFGASLGEIVSACVEVGLDGARQRLEQIHAAYTQPHRDIIALHEAVQRAISCLQNQRHS